MAQSWPWGNQIAVKKITACFYAKSSNNNNVRNYNVIVVTESSDHDRVASMSCLQKVVHKIEHMHKKMYANVYVWSDGMGSQFRFCYIFKLLAGKGPMDRIGETVKNVILRKVKSGRLVVHSPLEFSDAATKFVSSIHSVYLPEKENIVEPEDISMARKINQTLNIHKLEENVVKMVIVKSGMMNLQNAREVTMRVKSGYVVQYAISGTMKTVFYE